VSLVKTECMVVRLFFCESVIFNCENSAHGEDRLQGIYTMFCVIVIFICGDSVRCKDRLLGI
jgi:uncharacterized membrane protein